MRYGRFHTETVIHKKVRLYSNTVFDDVMRCTYDFSPSFVIVANILYFPLSNICLCSLSLQERIVYSVSLKKFSQIHRFIFPCLKTCNQTNDRSQCRIFNGKSIGFCHRSTIFFVGQLFSADRKLANFSVTNNKVG